jgi:hypothetical protein
MGSGEGEGDLGSKTFSNSVSKSYTLRYPIPGPNMQYGTQCYGNSQEGATSSTWRSPGKPPGEVKNWDLKIKSQ